MSTLLKDTCHYNAIGQGHLVLFGLIDERKNTHLKHYK